MVLYEEETEISTKGIKENFKAPTVLCNTRNVFLLKR